MASIRKTISGLKPDANYIFTVKPKNTEISASDEIPESIRIKTPSSSSTPSNITGLEIKSNFESVMFIFTAVNDQDFAEYEYEIYNSSVVAPANLVSSGRKRSTVFVVSVDNSSRTINPTTGVETVTNTKYYGRVRAINTSGRGGPWTEPVTHGGNTPLISDQYIGSLTAAKITAGVIGAEQIILRQPGGATPTYYSPPAATSVIRSSNYKEGGEGVGEGWLIRGDGYAEFDSTHIRGSLSASSIFINDHNKWNPTGGTTGGPYFKAGDASKYFQFDNGVFTLQGAIVDGQTSGGIQIKPNSLYFGSGNFNNGNTPFYVDTSSRFSLGDKLRYELVGSPATGSLTITGTINATGGTFTGTINGGTFNGGNLNVGSGDASAHIASDGTIWAGNDSYWASATDAAPFRVSSNGTVFANNIFATASLGGGSPGIKIFANGDGLNPSAATNGSIFIYNGANFVTRIGISDSAHMNIKTTSGGNTIFTNNGGRFGFGTEALSSRTVTVSGDAVLGAADSRGDLFSIGGFSGLVSGYSSRVARIAFGSGKASYLCDPGSSAALKNDITTIDTTTALSDIMTLIPKSFTWKHEVGDEDPPGIASYKALDYDRGFVLEDFDSTNYQFVITTPTDAFFELSESEILALSEASLQNTELFEPSYWKESAVIATSVGAIQELKNITDAIQEAVDQLIPIGTIQTYAGDMNSFQHYDKWMRCDGSYMNIADAPDLYDALTAFGTVFPYGPDIGSTFALPNMSKVVPVGFDYDNTDVDFTTVGLTGGEKEHTLTTSEMPSHTHTQNSHNHTQDAHGHGVSDPSHSHTIANMGTNPSDNAGTNGFVLTGASADTQGGVRGMTASFTGVSVNANTATNQAATATNQNSGGGEAHNNMQPYIVLNYIIKYK